MSSDDKGKNIANAFKVAYETCQNTNKLIAFLNQKAAEKGIYIPQTMKPLVRLKGNDLNDDYILVFQKKNDKSSLYVVDISLWDTSVEDDKPMIYISKFQYAEALDLNEYKFFLFSDPLWEDYEVTDFEYTGEKYKGFIKDELKSKNVYRGLISINGFSVDLTSITSANAEERIFGGFDSLIEK